jgi:glucose/mannose-6-phosphate isomerase
MSLLPAGTLDSLSMFEATAALPEQIQQAAAAAALVDGLPDFERIENVLVLGMGGSGIAGDVLAHVAGRFLAVPVVVHKGYAVPSFVSPSTLCFAVSCSGNTEETLEAAEEAYTFGAQLVTVSMGGRLAELAAEWNVPHVPVDQKIPQPRAAIGALAIPPMVVLERMGGFPGASQWIDDAVSQLQRRRDRLSADRNDAATLARKLGRTIPVVYGGSGIGQAAAGRWKTQINENAKAPAFAGTVPELTHNEIAGWGQHGDLTRQVFSLVTLRHDHEHPQTTRRFDLIAEIMDEVVAGRHAVQAEGEGPLAQFFDLVLFGDFVSLHLATQEQIDPGPVPILDHIKASLR